MDSRPRAAFLLATAATACPLAGTYDEREVIELLTFTGTLAAFVVMGSLIFKAAQFVVARIYPKGDAPAWVPQVATLVLALGASFMFELNVLPLVAPYFGGHLASVPLWAAEILTGIALAAIAEGAVTTFNVSMAAIAAIGDKSTSAAPAQDVRRFW